MARTALIVAGAAALTLSGCMANEAGGPGASAYYDCGNGTRLKVDALQGDRIQVQMNDDAPVVLPAEKAASGAKYMSPTHQFWDKGGEAMWTVGRMVPMTCQKIAVPRM
jgi:membrane-bound inhibitor of C-type lysozyme